MKPAEDQTYRNEDGGETWVVDPFGKHLNRFQFFGPDLCYAGGEVVYKYSTQAVNVENVTPSADRLTRGYAPRT